MRTVYVSCVNRIRVVSEAPCVNSIRRSEEVFICEAIPIFKLLHFNFFSGTLLEMDST